MKLNVYFGIAFRIIPLFLIGMLIAYVKPSLHNFLGNKIHVCKSQFCYNHGEFFNDGYDWGAMHYWFFWMCFVLFILSLVNCIVSIVNIVEKNYKF